MFEQFRSIVRSDLVVPDALSSRLDLFSTRSILGGTRACKVKRYRVSLVAAEREARDLYNDENSHTFYSVYY
jgi:hypothetical protein